MEIQKTKIEVWEIVLNNFDNFPNITFGGLFCLLRQKKIISWGEWYYLHDVMNKFNNTKKNSNLHLLNWSKDLIKSFIKKLKENAKN